MLFLVYINDLSRYLVECQTSLYDDDTTVYKFSQSHHIDIMLALRIEVSIIIKWLVLMRTSPLGEIVQHGCLICMGSK